MARENSRINVQMLGGLQAYELHYSAHLLFVSQHCLAIISKYPIHGRER